MEFFAVLRKDSPLGKFNNITPERIHRVQSEKGGSSIPEFYKKIVEIGLCDPLHHGLFEMSVVYMMREYYKSNGKVGWSKEEVKKMLTIAKYNNSGITAILNKGMESEKKDD